MDQRNQIRVARWKSRWQPCSILATECHQEGQSSPEVLNINLKSSWAFRVLPCHHEHEDLRLSMCSLTEKRPWSGRALLVTAWGARAHTGGLKAESLLSRAPGVHTAPQKWPQFTRRLKTPSAHLHDRRYQSPRMKDDAAARKGLDHPSCPSWLPQS